MLKAWLCAAKKDGSRLNRLILNYIYDASTNMIYPDVSGFSDFLDNYFKSRRNEKW
ncbi:MAG: hypothetical protein PVH61_43525 [Candidatus Aminicenantes bacterium]|jgi:hypothetical protein